MKISARLLVIQTIIVLAQTLEFPSFITSEDQHLTVGSTLDLNCSVDLGTVQASQQPIDVYKIRFRKGSQSPAESANFVYYNDSLTLQMIIPNISLHDNGTYICYYGNSTTIQSLSTVRVGDPPGPPENVTCWSNSFTDLQCNFCLGKQSVNLPVQWSMEYKLDDQFKNISDCSSPLARSGVACLICAKYQGPAILGPYTISINGVNEDFKVNILRHFEVMLDESIVIVSPVVSLKYSFTPVSSMVNLTWGYPEEVARDYVIVDYKITILSEEDWDNRILIFHQRNEQNEVYVLVDLIPYANYTVIVQAKSVNASGDLYWSNKSTVVFTTQDDVSYHAVSMTTGSYVMVDCQQNYMCLNLYWKNPERKFWNAPITSYLVDIERVNVTGKIVHEEETGNHPVSVTSSWTENITGPAVSSTVNTLMMKTSDYVVRLFVVNRKGVSPKHTELAIPSWDKGHYLRPDWVAVEISPYYVQITWYISPQYCGNVSMATFYWCTEDTERAMNSSVRLCKNNLDWITVDLNDEECGNETSLKLNNTLDIPNVKYAVSLATSSNHSGGMKWENFHFKMLGRVPIKPLFTVQAVGSSLLVEILYNDYYVSDGGRPYWYRIMYSEVNRFGPIDCSSDGHNETFPASFSRPSYTINNTHRGSKYVVCVAAGNSAGISNYGEPFNVTIPADPLKYNSDTLTVVLSVSVPLGIIIVVFVVVGIICCRKKCNKWKIDNNKITIPAYADETLMNGSYKMNKIHKNTSWDFANHDSGKGSDSGVISSRQEVPLHQQNGVRSTQNTEVRRSSTSSTTSSSSRPDRNYKRKKVSSPLPGYKLPGSYSYFEVKGGGSLDSVEYPDLASDRNLFDKEEDDDADKLDHKGGAKYDGFVYERRPNIYHEIHNEEKDSGEIDNNSMDSSNEANIASDQKSSAKSIKEISPVNFEYVDECLVNGLKNNFNNLTGSPAGMECLPNGIKNKVFSSLEMCNGKRENIANPSAIVPENETFTKSPNIKSNDFPIIQGAWVNATKEKPNGNPDKAIDQAIGIGCLDRTGYVDGKTLEIEVNVSEIHENTSNDYLKAAPTSGGQSGGNNANSEELTVSQRVDTSSKTSDYLTPKGKRPIANKEIENGTAPVSVSNVVSNQEDNITDTTDYDDMPDDDNDLFKGENLSSFIRSTSGETSGISNYKNPDIISLGQGSTVSDSSSSMTGEYITGRISGSVSPDEVSVQEMWRENLADLGGDVLDEEKTPTEVKEGTFEIEINNKDSSVLNERNKMTSNVNDSNFVKESGSDYGSHQQHSRSNQSSSESLVDNNMDVALGSTGNNKTTSVSLSESKTSSGGVSVESYVQCAVSDSAADHDRVTKVQVVPGSDEIPVQNIHDSLVGKVKSFSTQNGRKKINIDDTKF